jgi:hypothetical protein
MPSTSLVRLILLLTAFGLLTVTVVAQKCAPPEVIKNPKNTNIFSPEQEMILGDLTYQNMSREVRFVRDPQLVEYVQRIAERLIKHLPPTGLKFQFFIVDIPEANAFNVSGGYVFVSRKLIALANNEDELAGVIGHELGHAVSRHGATDFSVLLKKVLNVTSVGDRKDIAEKYNLLIEKWRTKSVSSQPEEESEQLQADRIGLFAIVAAGYDPEAVASFFGRLVEAKAAPANWFSDIFGRPKPEEKRLREIIKITQQLPSQCRDNRKAAASQEYLKWQADVLSYRYGNLKEELSGLLWKKQLSPKLRSDISHFAFSNDGNWILAQDDFAITVMRRSPLTVLFQIPITDAHPASFTPDNQFVVFGTRNLRFEKWSIAEQKPVQVRELVVRNDCWEHGFSPDGNYLVCFDYSLNLNVLDTQTGKRIWQKKDFYRLTLLEYIFWNLAADREANSESDRFFHIQFSPDSQVLLVARSNKFGLKVMVNFLTTEESDRTVLALDLKTLKPISLGGDVKHVVRRPFVFLDSSRILGMGPRLDDSGIFSFPSGKRLEKFAFGAEFIETTANPNYVILKPMVNAKMGIFDLTRKEVVVGADKEDATLWDKYVVFESINGQVMLSEYSYDENSKMLKWQTVDKIEIPTAPVSQVATAEVSGNAQWLAVSSKTRGAIWNLQTGERKMFVRGFRSVLLADNGDGLVDFPKYRESPRSLVVLKPATNETQPYTEVSDRGVNQYGRFILIRKSLNEPKAQNNDKDKPRKSQQEQEEAAENSLEKAVRFELKNVLDGKLVFTRDFPKEAPQFFFDSYSGRLILYWMLGSDVGKARLKEDSALAARAKALGNKDDDYLMEIVDCFAGKTVGTMLVETGKGSFSIDDGLSDGNWLILHDSENRVLAYSITDGNLRQRFFGTEATINAARDLIVVQNYPGELTFYSLTTGDIQNHLTVSNSAVFMRLSFDGQRLFVLSDQQAAYSFDVEKLLSVRAP